MNKTIEVGETFKITATTTPTGVPAEIEWSTDSEGIKLTFNGKTATVEALEAGPAEVVAKLKDNAELVATTSITVEEKEVVEP